MPSYTVRSGDNLSRIARRAGVNLLDLVAANPQINDPDLIQAGMKIQVPGKPLSQSARNVAAQRVASGSFSAGTFSATGVPGEGRMEVGQFRFGPGGGPGAAALGRTFGEIFAERGATSLSLGGLDEAPFVESVNRPISVEDVAPQTQDLGVTSPALRGLEDVISKVSPLRRIGGARTGGGAQARAGTGGVPTLPPTTRRAGGARTGGGTQARAGRRDILRERPPVSDESVTPDLRVILAIRAQREGLGRRGDTGAIRTLGGVSIDRFSPDMTTAERETIFREMVANGLPTDEALRLAFQTATPPFEVGTVINFDPVRRGAVAGQMFTALGGVSDPTAAQSIKARAFVDQIDTRFLPLSIADDQMATFVSLIERGMRPSQALHMATRTYGYNVTKDDSPQDIVNHVNTKPIEMTTEESNFRASNPITPGEKRFKPISGSARPDTLRGQQDNWDLNMVVTASYLITNDFRTDEIGSQVEDALTFLRALANNEAWAGAMVDKLLRGDTPLSGEQQERMMVLVNLALTDPEALLRLDGIREGGHRAAQEWLASNGFENTTGDIWVDREAVDSIYGTRRSGVADLIPGGGMTAWGTSGGTGGGGRGGSGGGGSGGIGGLGGRATALYQWRISAPSVS